MKTLTQDHFNSLSLIVFFTPTWVIFPKQGQATKVFKQMAPPLPLPVVGFRDFRKLVQPLLIRHEGRLHHGGPTRDVTGPIER